MLRTFNILKSSSSRVLRDLYPLPDQQRSLQQQTHPQTACSPRSSWSTHRHTPTHEGYNLLQPLARALGALRYCNHKRSAWSREPFGWTNFLEWAWTCSAGLQAKKQHKTARVGLARATHVMADGVEVGRTRSVKLVRGWVNSDSSGPARAECSFDRVSSVFL